MYLFCIFFLTICLLIIKISTNNKFNKNFYRFTDIPEAIYDVVSLESLIANDNVIATIDVSSLEKLKRLAILNLTNNNIAHVPPELGNLKNLR